MASEEDEEIFEITDFTTATEWERFIARIEEVIHEWQLTNPQRGVSLKRGDICNGSWKKRMDTLTFADTRFNITHHCLELEDNSQNEAAVENSGEDPLPQALEDIMSMENDFPFRAHCLSRWYGLREFVVLTPTVYMDAIASESKVKLLISSLCVAVNNSNCSIPFFVQVHHVNESYYLGICEGGGIRTNFEMVHLQKSPQKANHLSGLLDIFKAKLASPRLNAPVSVSIRFTFVLHDWTEFVWPQQPPDFDLLLGEIGIHELGQLPFGACEDPVSEFFLSTTWPCMSEDVIVDNDVYSDLDPLQAPQWSLRVNLVDNPPCLLYDYLSSLVSLSKRHDSVECFLAKNSDEGIERHFAQPLDRLTDRIPLNVNVSVSSVVGKPISRRLSKLENKPIASSQLQQILDYLFPDARPKATEKIKSKTDDTEESTNVLSHSEDTFRSLKSAPEDSLTWRLALCIAHVNHGYKSVAAVAHLWSEFVLEMRYRWEIAFPLPELESGLPDLGCCLLHQKLQMLNCCIERKKQRELRQNRNLSGDRRRSEDERESSSDEEFFECYEKTCSSTDVTLDTERPASNVSSNSNRSRSKERPVSSVSSGSTDGVYKDTVTHQPDGRNRKCGDLHLLHSDQPLYIPVTQEPTPMTEDLLEEHAEVLVQLGTDAQGTELRAKMQSACLLSDMEAFKAANPGCCLEDFVRWYSPRDWIQEDDEGKKGHLSTRMMLPGNIWTDVWETANPVPSRRQRRLFDDTREAEKVLHWLTSLTVGQLVNHLMPVLLHAALLTAAKAMGKSDPDSIEMIAQKTSKMLRAPKVDLKRYEEVARLISGLEVTTARITSLITKLSSGDVVPEIEKVIKELLTQVEVQLVGASRGPAGQAVVKLFTQAQKSINMLIDVDSSDEDVANSDDGSTKSKTHPAISEFPKPTAREFILRATVPRPAPYSMPTPQRLFCVLQSDETRLAGAFSQDTTFQ